MVHGGQELPLRHRGRHGVGVPGAEQALEHPPAVADVAVLGQVDPAEPAVGQAAEHLVLAADQIPRLQLRGEGERVPQLRQKPSASPGRPSLARPTGCWQLGQNRLLSGTCGSASIALAGSWAGTGGTSTRPAPRFPRDDRPVLRVRAAGAGAAARAHAAAGARRGRERAPFVVGRRDRHRRGWRPSRTRCSTRLRWCRRSPAGCRWPVPPEPGGRNRGGRGGRGGGGRRGGHPADGAVPVFDGAAAARLRALGGGGGHCGCLRPLSAKIACW